MRSSASLRSRSIRTGTTVAAAVAAAGVVALAGAPAAFAVGESGDIDIRSISWHSRGERNGVEVCQFALVASNFGELQQLEWTITERPPGNTLTNLLPLSNGQARSQEYLLPEGTYQLEWTVGVKKQKSFEVDCSKHGQGGNGSRGEGEGRGSSESGAMANKSDKGAGEIYDKPSGAVPAGGGGVPEMESVSSEGESNVGTSAALVAGAAGIAGLIMVRRSARRRARNEA
ncbi:hypothetical protein [Streptomyces sp. NPDC005752]|uniref:hypothetical protein n=1 Tax=Streptomyces sp. NPDC005752 TaxID=3157065 RepID=UPI0033DF585A